MDSKSVGKRISKLRKRKGLLQKELAEKLNVTVKTISKWETGNGYPDITQLPILSELFEVSIEYILNGDD